MILTFESVDEILQCDHSNDSSSVVLSRGTIYILVFYKIKFEICLEFNYNKLSFFFSQELLELGIIPKEDCVLQMVRALL